MLQNLLKLSVLGGHGMVYFVYVQNSKLKTCFELSIVILCVKGSLNKQHLRSNQTHSVTLPNEFIMGLGKNVFD